MNNQNYIPLIIGIIGVIVFALSYLGFSPPEVSYTTSIETDYTENIFFKYSITTFPIKVEVKEVEDLMSNDSVKIGIAGQRNELNFGRIPVGASTTKILEIKNNEKTSAKAKVEVFGPMSSFTVGIDTEKLLPSSKKSEIKIKCEPLSTGNYTGELKVVIISPKSSSFEQLLKLV